MQPTQNTRNASGLSPRVPGSTRSAPVAANTVQAASHESAIKLLGIWRLGAPIYASAHSRLFTAQPADADGSPRFDYVIRAVSDYREHRDQSIAQLERFVAAASVACHPNLIVVLDSSLHSASPFLVMPRLSGAGLSQIMATSTPQPLPVILWTVRQVAQALASLHQASWIHGDVKPENLFMSEQGHLTLLDLGFASQQGSPKPSAFIGTPRYAAPELLDDTVTSITAASDVYSLGRVLLELLAWSSPTIKNQATIEPVADLITEMIEQDDKARPAAHEVASRLLRLEIETLGEHIQPMPPVVHSRRVA